MCIYIHACIHVTVSPSRTHASYIITCKSFRHTHLHTYTRVRTLYLSYSHAHSHTHVCVRVHTYTLSFSRTYTCVQTHTHAHTHTHTSSQAAPFEGLPVPSQLHHTNTLPHTHVHTLSPSLPLLHSLSFSPSPPHPPLSHIQTQEAKQRLKGFPRLPNSITACDFNGSGDVFAYAVSYDWAKGYLHAKEPYLSAINPYLEPCL